MDDSAQYSHHCHKQYRIDADIEIDLSQAAPGIAASSFNKDL